MSEEDTWQPISANEAESERASLRWSGDGLDQGFSRPAAVEPLAGRLERATRVLSCRDMTTQMLMSWYEQDAPIRFWNGVWVKGIRVDFLVLTWKGVFCVWSVDHRWTVNQAAIVEPARAQIQAELAGWAGKVEAVFHSPREPTGWRRHLMVHPYTNQPVDIVVMRGEISQLLYEWQPIGGVGLDPEWMYWISDAAQPRWWRSNEGRLTAPEIPPEEQL